MTNDLSRFISAQEKNYNIALSEIRNGRKQSHWMWYIFPQLKGLGYSYNALYYGISDIDEAAAYLSHPVLGNRLTTICSELLKHTGKSAVEIFGDTDSIKLKSSLTLFSMVPETNPVFESLLDKFFSGNRCRYTVNNAAK